MPEGSPEAHSRVSLTLARDEDVIILISKMPSVHIYIYIYIYIYICTFSPGFFGGKTVECCAFVVGTVKNQLNHKHYL